MKRLQQLREKMNEHQLDGMLITSPINRRYMTKFTGTAGVAVVSLTEAKLITDFRYTEQANEQAKGYEIVQHKDSIVEEVANQIEKMAIKKIGFEEDHVTYSVYHTYEKKLNAELVPVARLIEELRMIKDDAEIQLIKTAAAIADDAFEHIVSYIRPGLSELDVANELEFFMRKQGASSSSFDTIVASGYRSALPHGVASSKRIEKGELVTLDFGAYYQGYCSDITRTVAVGQPNAELKKIYGIVKEAQRLGVEGIRAGMTGKEADALTRDYITDQGYGEYFGHSTGHGIGLEIHEGPSLSIKNETKLEAGMVVTVEPGIYLSGLGGVRIEDDVLIKKDGNEVLTHAKKDLMILGE